MVVNVLEAGHVSSGAGGRLRFWGVVGLALVLHALLLLSARPTLLSSAPAEGADAAVVAVRMLEAAINTPSAVVETISTLTPAMPASLPVTAVVPQRVVQKPPRATLAAASAAALKSSAVLAAVDVQPVASVAASAPVAPPASAPSAAAPGLPPAPAYLTSGRLDPGPQPLSEITPLYPEEGKLQQGWVVLRLLINEAGQVDNAAVHSAYPPGVFDAAALEAFGRAQYSPGKLLGVAVKSQVTFKVEFTPIDRGEQVSGRNY